MGMKIKDIVRNSRLRELDLESDKWKSMGIEIFKIESFQYRFIQHGKEIDYFPISGKFHIVKENRWGSIPAYDFHKLFDIPR